MKRILVIQQKMIGDVLTSSIICTNLKKQYPDAVIDYLINSNCYAVVENNPYIDNFILFKPEYRSSKIAFFKFLKEINKTKYDILIDAYGKLESNLITLFSTSPTKISYNKWYTHFLYSHPINRLTKSASEIGLAIENRLLLIKGLVRESAEVEIKPKIFLDHKEVENALQFLKSNNIDSEKFVVMISVLGSGNKKTYPLTYMAKVLDEIVNKTDAVLLFNYIPNQEEDAKKVYDLCSDETKKQIKFGVFANSLRDFLGVLSLCSGLIGNEGGAINMAKALNIPTFSIFASGTSKQGWDLFKSEKNVSVHLNDFMPELFTAKTKKQIRNRVFELYEQFNPNLFKDLLNEFLTIIKK
ncbi:MAG: glycosyltransferase family 9 protein [Lutibacter sp.]|jgi:heptosyltransferase-2